MTIAHLPLPPDPKAALRELVQQALDQLCIASKLSPKETRVANLILDGVPMKQLGDLTGNTEKTIKTHCHEIYRKTGTRCAREFVAKVIGRRA